MNHGRRLILTVTTTLLAAILALVTTPVPVASGAAAGPGSAEGTVTDGAAPLPGIEVRFYLGGQVVGQDATDVNGYYLVEELPPDPHYYVEFYEPDGDYATEWYINRNPGVFTYDFVAIAADQRTTMVGTVLEPEATIGGQLTTATGAPLVGGKVSLWLGVSGGYSSWRTVYTTDATGHYTIDRLKAGTYLVEFYDPATGIQEFWDNATNLYASTPVVLASGTAATADAVLGGPITNTQAPTISGTPEVGRTLTANPGAWTPAGVALAYRWVVGADTDPTDDPTGAVYVPRSADVGKTIRVHVTATATGWLTGTATSAATAPVTSPPVTPPPVTPAVVNVERPRIKGVARVGRTVRVSRGEWVPEAVTRSYQWYVAGRRVRGATLRHFFLRPAYAGERVAVRVRATAPGLSPVTVWPRMVRVRR